MREGFLTGTHGPRVKITKGEEPMKRTIAGVLLVMGLGAGTLFADDGHGRGRDVRRDEARITHDRRELRRGVYGGNYRAARRERRELRADYRDLHHDRYWGR
jgi:hypothetical protein